MEKTPFDYFNRLSPELRVISVMIVVVVFLIIVALAAYYCYSLAKSGKIKDDDLNALKKRDDVNKTQSIANSNQIKKLGNAIKKTKDQSDENKKNNSENKKEINKVNENLKSNKGKIDKIKEEQDKMAKDIEKIKNNLNGGGGPKQPEPNSKSIQISKTAEAICLALQRKDYPEAISFFSEKNSFCNHKPSLMLLRKTLEGKLKEKDVLSDNSVKKSIETMLKETKHYLAALEPKQSVDSNSRLGPLPGNFGGKPNYMPRPPMNFPYGNDQQSYYEQQPMFGPLPGNFGGKPNYMPRPSMNFPYGNDQQSYYEQQPMFGPYSRNFGGKSSSVLESIKEDDKEENDDERKKDTNKTNNEENNNNERNNIQHDENNKDNNILEKIDNNVDKNTKALKQEQNRSMNFPYGNDQQSYYEQQPMFGPLPGNFGGKPNYMLRQPIYDITRKRSMPMNNFNSGQKKIDNRIDVNLNSNQKQNLI